MNMQGKKQIFIAIEGNLGSKKSIIIEYIKDHYKNIIPWLTCQNAPIEENENKTLTPGRKIYPFLEMHNKPHKNTVTNILYHIEQVGRKNFKKLMSELDETTCQKIILMNRYFADIYQWIYLEQHVGTIGHQEAAYLQHQMAQYHPHILPDLIVKIKNHEKECFQKFYQQYQWKAEINITVIENKINAYHKLRKVHQPSIPSIEINIGPHDDLEISIHHLIKMIEKKLNIFLQPQKTLKYPSSTLYTQELALWHQQDQEREEEEKAIKAAKQGKKDDYQS